jgi:hypothetical protein
MRGTMPPIRDITPQSTLKRGKMVHAGRLWLSVGEFVDALRQRASGVDPSRVLRS